MNDEPSENAASNMELLIPAVDVEMVVGETPIQFNDDPPPSSMQTYVDEMRLSGLLSADIKCFKRAYKNLEDIKYVKSHCTSCDKHLGSAPNQRDARYEHPLLRVVVCQQCFEFYGSGDFEKDEDGSEMYCRWCGEGGDVFCCTKCPFVFCKKCIQQNLGSGTARSIQSSLHWWCFVCNPEAICRLRAACWALKKWSAQMLQKAEVESSIDVATDANVCCLRTRKPAQAYGPAKRKSRSRKRPADAKKPFVWQVPAPHEAQHEVICTPDIIPVDDSPCSSPKPGPALPALVPVKPKPPVQAPVPRAPVPPVVRPPIQVLAPPPTPPPLQSLPARPPIQTMAELQKQLAAAYPQKVFITQAPPPAAKPVLLNPAPAPGSAAPRKLVPLGDASRYKLLITNPVASRTNYLLAQLTTAGGAAPTTTATSTAVAAPAPPPPPPPPAAPVALDWFGQSLQHCTEVTDFIAGKVAGLRAAHARAHTSVALMDELHYTMQTFLFAAVEKLRGIKQLMYSNFMAQHGARLLNPYSRAPKRRRTAPASASSSSSAEDVVPRRWKRRRVGRRTRDPDDVPLDMVVTYESDEQHSPAGDEVELVGEIQTRGVSNEVISLLESTDEEDAPATNGMPGHRPTELLIHPSGRVEHVPLAGEGTEPVSTSSKVPEEQDVAPADVGGGDGQQTPVAEVDVEDVITGAVLPNSNSSRSFKRFADAFSMFISAEPPEVDERPSADRVLELVGSDPVYLDNGSLGVPPGDVAEFVRQGQANSVDRNSDTEPLATDAGSAAKSPRAKGKGKGKMGKTKRSANAGSSVATSELRLAGEIVTIDPVPGNSAAGANTLSAECQG